MRLVAAALLLACGAALAAPAPAQVLLPPLAQGEVSLQTLGLGQVRSPADRAMLRAEIVAQGADHASAGRALGARLDEVRAALRAAGVADRDVETGAVSIARDEDAAASSQALATALAAGRAPSMAMSGGWPTTTASVALVVLVRDLTRLAAVRAAIPVSGMTTLQPEYFLANDRAQRRQAWEQAMQSARADAETQAALLNMRIVRIRRVSERTGMDAFSLAANEVPTILRQLSAMWRMQLSEIDTMVAVGVEFALAPR